LIRGKGENLIRLFACDLDDTLLNGAHMSDDIIKNALKEVIAHGKCFTISTGRSCSMEELKNMGMAEEGMYNITMNGSLIRDWKGNILYRTTLDPEIVKDFWNAFPEVNILCSGQDHTFVRGSREQEWERRKKMPNLTPEREKEQKERMDKHEIFNATISDVLSEPIMKMNYHIEDEALAARMDAFLEGYKDRVVNAPFESHAYEITELHTHKGSGVKWLADQLGIAMDEIAVYGDSWNDLEMLAMFPHSYTTSNGIPKAKEIAGMTLGYCEDHAVPYHILKTLEEEK
jgi:Cof subfamily protein (haloacid dehalogenase superfamily)